MTWELLAGLAAALLGSNFLTILVSSRLNRRRHQTEQYTLEASLRKSLMDEIHQLYERVARLEVLVRERDARIDELERRLALYESVQR